MRPGADKVCQGWVLSPGLVSVGAGFGFRNRRSGPPIGTFA